MRHKLSRAPTFDERSLMHRRMACSHESFSTAVLAITMNDFSSDTTNMPVSPSFKKRDQGIREGQSMRESRAALRSWPRCGMLVHNVFPSYQGLSRSACFQSSPNIW